MNAPATRPPVPAVAARFMSAAGTRTGSTSSMASAARRSRFPMPRSAHRFVLTAPNSDPVIPAKSPSAE